MSRLLTHPLVILVIGAVLSGLLIPSITRQWQERQKELELKTNLVTEIIELVTEILICRQYYLSAVFEYREYQRKQRHQDTELVAQYTQSMATQGEKLDNANIKWEVKSAVIETKLQVYFPETRIATRWSEFAKAISILVQLTEVPQGDRTDVWIPFWRALPIKMGEEDAEDPNNRQNWPVQKKAILQNQTYLIQMILAAKSTTIRPPTLLEKLLSRWREWRKKRSTTAA